MSKFAILIQLLRTFGPVILQAVLDALKSQPAQSAADSSEPSAAVNLDATREDFIKECTTAGVSEADANAAADQLQQ